MQPYGSKTPIKFSIPADSNQYVSLKDSYLFVNCHMEETTDVQCNFMADEPPWKRHCQDGIQSSAPKKVKRKANGQRDEDSGDDSEYDVMMSSASVVTHISVAPLLAEAESKYMAHQNALADAEEVKSTDTVKYAELIKAAEALEDMAVLAIEQYITGKNTLKAEEMPGGYVVLVDNVLHSVWSGVDISVNQENVSTMNGENMFKVNMESVLNNSASTKTYQLET